MDTRTLVVVLAATVFGTLAWRWLRAGHYRRDDEGGPLPRHLWVPALAPFVGLVVALGLADRLGDLHGEIERRFGKEAKIVWLNIRRPRWPWRLFSAAVGATLEILEERSARARLGL